MAIKKITDNKTLSTVKRGVPIVGDFRKGEEKDERGRWGKDLEDGSWRVTFREGYEMFQEAFNQVFADTREPFIIATIDTTPDEVFNDFYRLYGGNGLAQIVCDGEKIQFSADKQSQCMGCPAKRESATSAKEKAQFCAPNAYFRFTIPKFNRAMQMPVPFLFQFSVTSVTELQHIKKELITAYDEKGSLVNELFMLYRNNRRFNRGGKANDKSLAYVLWLDKNLDEKAQEAQLRLESGEIEQPQAQLPSPEISHSDIDNPIPDDELSDATKQAQENMKQDYLDKVKIAADKFLHMGLKTFLFQFGAFADFDALYAKHPDFEQLKIAVNNWIVEKKVIVRIIACETRPSGKSKIMSIPYGFGSVIAGSRSTFDSVSHEKAYADYTNEKGGKSNLTRDGWHKFQDVFGVEYLSMTLQKNSKGSIEISHISVDEIPF